jgi:hypothetical protein
MAASIVHHGDLVERAKTAKFREEQSVFAGPAIVSASG